MRRREKDLGFWLGRHEQEKPAGKPGWGATIRSWLRPPILVTTVDLLPCAAIEVKVKVGTGEFVQAAAVLNGLQFLDRRRWASSTPTTRMDLEESGAGHDTLPDGLPCVIKVNLWTTVDRQTRNGELIPIPRVRVSSLLKAGDGLLTRSLTFFDNLPPSADASAWFLPVGASVHLGTPRFIRFPHSRKSVDLDRLGVQETERLVHEAETVRGIEHGQGELLAVFPKVPVEVVSRMRFVQATRQLLYTLIPKPNLMRTRVHELLAVRDRGSGETHLVPHRTRYRMAFFA